MDNVICKVCKKNFKRITHKHLKTHNMTEDGYKKLYPDDELISKGTRLRLATNSIEHFTEKHGVDGEQRYREYKEFMGVKNTLAYKKLKYGWSEEDFTKYNNSRAITLENMVKKYGSRIGTQKYNEYCKIQSVSGVSLEYFKSKHGDQEGKIIFDRVNKSKAHNLENYIKKYGSVEIATKKLEEFFHRLNEVGFNSAVQKEFISLIMLQIETHLYSCLNNEFGVWSHNIGRYVKYDLVDEENKKVIEFNGDFWHCNPKKYHKSFIHPIMKRTAADIWERDHIKLSEMESRGYETMVVWESDFLSDKNNIIEECVQWMKQKNTNS
jgi:G:T-mismatch repair DNA endonuclease (very short patch repair protein)